MSDNELILRPRWLAALLGAMTIFLVVASLATQLALRTSDSSTVGWVALLLSVDGEKNIPAAFNSVLLLLAALLLLLIAALKRKHAQPFVTHWFVLAAGFTIMAVDEAMSLHEQLFRVMRNVLDQNLGAFHFALIVPGLVLVLVLVLASFFIRFLWRLPRRTAVMFVAAAALYLGGALGIDMIGEFYADANGKDSVAYTMIFTLEEGLEMAGATLYIYALLVYLGEQYRGVRVKIPPPAGA